MVRAMEGLSSASNQAFAGGQRALARRKPGRNAPYLDATIGTYSSPRIHRAISRRTRILSTACRAMYLFSGSRILRPRAGLKFFVDVKPEIFDQDWLGSVFPDMFSQLKPVESDVNAPQ